MRRFALSVNFFLAAPLYFFAVPPCFPVLLFWPRIAARPLEPALISAPARREPNYIKGCGSLASVFTAKDLSVCTAWGSAEAPYLQVALRFRQPPTNGRLSLPKRWLDQVVFQIFH
jgi:hypothetical protein